VVPGTGGGIGPHNCIQPRAPKNFNPALHIQEMFSDARFHSERQAVNDGV